MAREIGEGLLLAAPVVMFVFWYFCPSYPAFPSKTSHWNDSA
jgi:hypothetical protein